MTRLTDRAHELIAAVLQPGEIAVDATAGNGHDTLFLCETVGPAGTVYALDIQAAALEQATALLAQSEQYQCEFICCDHSLLQELIPEDVQGTIGAIMFNLGYLPGGDHGQITKTDSTLKALAAGLVLLRPGGILTILAYPGHAGGDAEMAAVVEQMRQLDPDVYQTEEILAQSDSPRAPRLFVIRKEAK